jgi:hypothetical protein
MCWNAFNFHACVAGMAFAILAVVAIESGAAPTPSASSTGTRDGQWLATHLKAVIDQGDLYRPEQLARTLDLVIQGSESSTFNPSPNCSQRYGDRSFVHTNYRMHGDWYKPTSEGIQHMKFPQAFINPAGEVGDPRIKFESFYTTSCNQNSALTHETSASLGLSGLSSFSCFTRERLKALINADFYMATDGVALSVYSGPPNEQYGISLEFSFRMGAPCALGASIRQEDRSGMRYERAWAKQRSCLDRAEKEYCAVHTTATLDELNEANRLAETACGNLESFYQREPLNGRPPPTRPRTCLDSSKPACEQTVPCE